MADESSFATLRIELVEQLPVSILRLLPQHVLRTFLASVLDRMGISSNNVAVSVAIGHLKLIRERASDGCFSTKRMQARWARDYYNGAWKQRQEELWDGAEGFKNEGGTSYIVRKCKSWSCDMYEFLMTEPSQRIVEYLDSIRIAWEQIPRSLIGGADYAAADKLYNAYDSVRDY
jgi:hypothetical protein